MTRTEERDENGMTRTEVRKDRIRVLQALSRTRKKFDERARRREAADAKSVN